MPDNQLRERELNEVAQAARIIRRHFDNVLICANKFDPTENRTVCYQMATGNLVAIKGQTFEFLNDKETTLSIYEDDGETLAECDEEGDAPAPGEEDEDSRGNR
jgi:hypothetical protein